MGSIAWVGDVSHRVIEDFYPALAEDIYGPGVLTLVARRGEAVAARSRS
jgi:hypothetical protein